jgi:DNA uptake protein ComE-like DNA-binding protein
MDFFFGYFAASKAQIHSSLVLIVLIIILLFWPFLESLFTSKTLTLLAPQTVFTSQSSPKLLTKRRACRPFIPEQLKVEDWVELGFSKFIAERILRYQLRHPIKNFKDLTCVYGIDTLLLQALKPCMRFDAHVNKQLYKSQTNQLALEINTADTQALEQLPFIGMKLAKRIVDYRTRLGGFVSLDQLMELYGLKQEQYEQMTKYLKVDPKLIQYIAINLVGFDQLRLHPYLTYSQAKAIVNFRNQHGPFASSIDLQKTLVLDDVQLNKLLPYLKF